MSFQIPGQKQQSRTSMSLSLPLTCAWFGLICIDYEVVWSSIADFRHEAPFESGRETGTTASTQSTRLHLVDDPIATETDEILRAIPITLNTQRKRKQSPYKCERPSATMQHSILQRLSSFVIRTRFMAASMPKSSSPYRLVKMRSWSFNPPYTLTFVLAAVLAAAAGAAGAAGVVGGEGVGAARPGAFVGLGVGAPTPAPMVEKRRGATHAARTYMHDE
jgi:hypothetical protein